MTRPRLHLVGMPHTQLNDEYLSCAYTQKVVKFLAMMEGRYPITYYGGEVAPKSSLVEHVVCIREEERRGWFGDGFDTVKSPFQWVGSAPYWSKLIERATAAVRERAQKHDLVLLTSGGDTMSPIGAAVKDRCMTLEWAVGYEGVSDHYAAFESYCWQHHVYGLKGWRNGRAFDAVIPNYFDPSDFLPVREADDYLLFLGRVTARKGPHIAGEIARHLGKKLIIAGPGATQKCPGATVYGDGVEIPAGNVLYVGEVGKAERAELIAKAACMLSPTNYVEPFGGSAVEAMIGGCPVVAHDWGAFTETVIEGATGYRFRSLQQGCDAVERAIHALDRRQVSAAALRRYSLDAVRPKFDAWFDQINTLWKNGWYEMRNDTDTTHVTPETPHTPVEKPPIQKPPVLTCSKCEVPIDHLAAQNFCMKDGLLHTFPVSPPDAVTTATDLAHDAAHDDHADHEAFEKDFWGSCRNTFSEESKHSVYARLMGLSWIGSGDRLDGFGWNVIGKRVLDMGGGPVSMLLKTVGLVEGAVVDPLKFPPWVYERYKASNIHGYVKSAEDADTLWTGTKVFDEVWIYNVLQHVHDPAKIIANAKRLAPVLRIFEWIDMPVYPGHPHSLTKESLEGWIGKPGSTAHLNESGCFGRCFYGTFIF